MAKRKKAREGKKYPLWLRLCLWLLALLLVMAAAAAGGVVGLFHLYGRDSNLPNIKSIYDYRPKTVTRIFDRKGRLIGELAAERRTVVPYKQFPELLVKAVVSSEDADFFKHKGLDYPGMVRAFIANVRAGRFVQGGSTITQQVVKTFFLTPERTIKRKMQEVILARRLENELSKEDILFLYLNQIYLGHGRYGMQEASRFFFHKDVGQLTLAEIATLAGLPQSPERLSPLKHKARAKKRQVYVLKQMVRLGFISRDVQRKVARNPITVVRRKRTYYDAAPEFTDRVRVKLAGMFGKDKLPTLGTTVRTTIDVKLQIAAREAVRKGLQSLDLRQKYRRGRRLSKKKRARMLARLARTQKKFSEGICYSGVVTNVDDEEQELEVNLGSRKGRVLLAGDERYNPQGDAPSTRFRVGDQVRVRKATKHFRYEGGPQAAMVAMDPRTGDVLAMVGGYSFRRGDFNRALRARRQPGSAFKPLVYAAAIDSGKVTAATVVDDTPVVYGKWIPRNFDGRHRGPVRVRQALAHSINSIAARLLDTVKVEPVRKLAASLGISTRLGKDLSLSLGTSEVIPAELAAVYSAFANSGKRVIPRYISRVGNKAQKVAPQEQVMRPEVAYIMTSMMQSVVREGTARRARRLRRKVAGKTGTTNKHKDAWFAGFTPQMVAVVWVGFDDTSTLGRRETGGRAALPIWVDFMRRALKGRPRLPFSQPPGVVVHRIDSATGLLAPEGAADVLEEYFIQGTQPKETARTPDQVDPSTILMDPEMP